jgi:hypothetical protein
MTLLEARQALARKLNIDLGSIASNDLFTEADLNDSIDAGVKRAWDYKPWSFTEKTYTTTSTSDAYYDYPADFEDESITRITVNGVRYPKKDFDDYQRYFSDWPSDDAKIWSDHGRFYFLNLNAHTVGATIQVTGKLRAPTLTSDSDLLPFSPTTDNQESSGNRAIVGLAYAEALSSEKLKNYAQAAVEEKRAYGILEILWKPMGARRANEQSVNRPFFDVPDYFGGGWSGSKHTIANFDL